MIVTATLIKNMFDIDQKPKPSPEDLFLFLDIIIKYISNAKYNIMQFIQHSVINTVLLDSYFTLNSLSLENVKAAIGHWDITYYFKVTKSSEREHKRLMTIFKSVITYLDVISLIAPKEDGKRKPKSLRKKRKLRKRSFPKKR